ncbi:uncharacterized protein LOC130591658 [Beta vulgaris subsp. vulgaris]|uniref:uncharacterized protein LOC130591658 n=1 Tax=Beta vulgaris subsp. vulgaris TaxID=3555 RepID=UPI00254863C6|nr:uncharacterized protein LOC130591658 [Beta vulgaris subsp. vulgaris]
MSEKNDKQQVVPYADPFYLGSSDHSNAGLGPIVFNGGNYLNWSRSVKMALGAKNKLGFIDGMISKLAIESELYSLWQRNDCMIRCWLSASVTPEIAEQMLICDSAQEFWNELSERHGQTNAPQLYSLKKEVNGLQQNNLSVDAYYGKLKRYWDELNNIEGFPYCECGAMSKCTCNILKKLAERAAKKR